MNNRKMKPLAAAIGTAFAMSLTAGAVADEANPFQAQLIEDGTLLAAGHGEGGCGEDKDAKGSKGSKEGDEAKCGEGNCGEGNCGEGNCGESKAGEGHEAEGEAGGEEEAGEASDES